jgi:hypothetical protein
MERKKVSEQKQVKRMMNELTRLNRVFGRLIYLSSKLLENLVYRDN